MSLKDLRTSVPERSRLWLTWSRVFKLDNNDVRLHNVTLTGPVLLDCASMDSAGSIFLDLTTHFVVILTKPYIIKASWDELVSQGTDKVVLKSLLIEDRDFGLLHRLTPNDRILLNCEGHTTEAEERRQYKVAFQAMIYSQLLEPYEFIK